MTSNDISREDILIFLSSMGVVLPKDTKMPMEDLNKRLGNALDASQQFDQLLGTKTVDPSEFTQWTGKDILKASHRNNIQEKVTGTGAMSQPKKGPLSAKEDIFRELRQSILAIAHSCDEDHMDVYYMDGEEKWAIFVRVCPTDSEDLHAFSLIHIFRFCAYLKSRTMFLSFYLSIGSSSRRPLRRWKH